MGAVAAAGLYAADALWQGAPPRPDPDFRQMDVLSIQSSVAYGHVGNDAATFALQRLGVEAWRLDTVTFSNHPAHGGFRGWAEPAERLTDLLDGLAERGFLARCEAVLSGYLGTAANGAVVADAVTRLRAHRPAAPYCCDPVMGDRPQGLFVAADIPAMFRDRLLPLADIATPNAFELERLTGLPATDRASALTAARTLLAAGPKLAVVTGLPAAGEAVETLAVTGDGAWSAVCPRVAAPAFGAGDTFTAILLARWLEKRDPARALAFAVSTVHALLVETARTGADELRLVAAQDAILAPPRLFSAQRID